MIAGGNTNYLYALKGALLALIGFGLVTFFFPSHGASDPVELILTVASVLFAILVGFFISRANNRSDKVRDLVAAEDAHWLTLYKTASTINESFAKRIRELVDQYYIMVFDFVEFNYYKIGAAIFLSVYDELKRIKSRIKSPTDSEAYGAILLELSQLEELRNSTSAVMSERIRRGQWTSLVLLATIIIVSLFYLRVPEFYAQISTTMLSTAIVLVLLFVRDLQNFRISGGLILIESGQEIFDFIGKPRYYHHSYIDSGMVRIPDNIKVYRKGLHKPGEKPNIKTVRRK
jgi:hypothetical protein